MNQKKFFSVNVSKYVSTYNFDVYRPASINQPKSESVMFITDKFIKLSECLLQCEKCLVFWPENVEVPENISKLHAICCVENPRREFCRFFQDNHITHLPEPEKFKVINGAYIADGAKIGYNCRILPCTYIGSEVEIGDNVYIGAGTKIVGEVHIGNNVIIRENTVIGADGLGVERDESGVGIAMPQFGGIVIEDDVQIGAMCVIGRGAIDDTIIKRGVKIDCDCFISHNTYVDEDAFIVGETIMFGRSSVGKQAYVSGNATIMDGKHIGDRALVGMGSVVTKNVPDEAIVMGNPAKKLW